jgi:DNA repair protein RadD
LGKTRTLSLRMRESWEKHAEELLSDIGHDSINFSAVLHPDTPQSSDLVEETSKLLVKSSRRPALFNYQKEIVAKVLESLPQTGGLLALPTGAGKTRAALAICLEGICNQKLNRIVWLATTGELIDQAYASAISLYEMHGGIDKLFLSKSLTENPQNPGVPTIIFTTPQAVYQRAQRGKGLSQKPSLVIFDEAHQLGARTFNIAVSSLGCLDKNNPVPLLGLSATPGRSSETETEDLVKLFNGRLLTSESLGTNPIQSLEQMGVLSKIEFKTIPTKVAPGPDLRPRLQITYNLCKRLVQRRQSHPLVFAPSVDAAIALAAVLNETGFRADAIHSGLDPEIRRNAIGRFADGSTDVLTNHRILATGYDCPAVSDVIFVNEVGSAIQFEQMVGRACRGTKTGGSYKSTVWEFDDHRQLHGLPQSYRRYSDFRWE